MADRLPLGGIKPAARPVGAFITPAQIEAPKPAAPARLKASNGGIGLQATAKKPDVQGYSPGEQLGQALQNFAPQLTKTLSAGLELYASHEYQQGQNEVMKAQALAERQVEQSSVDYAQANQALARKDPFAAMAMDQTNPFRHAGRQMALSQLASTMVGPAMEQEYRARAGELALLDPTDPAINEVKAQAVNRITQQFGLDPTKAGFTKHFLPAMNRSWEKITAQQIQDRNNYLKDTVWRTAGAQMAAQMRAWKGQGVDSSQGPQMMRNFEQLLDGEATRLGLPGEATEMKIKAIQLAQQLLTADGETEWAQMLGNIPVGPPDSTGFRPTAAQLYGLELMEADDKYGEIRRRTLERQLEPIKDAFRDEAARIGYEMEDGPEKAEALNNLIRIYGRPDPETGRPALPLGDLLEIAGSANKLGEEVMSQAYDPNAAGDFLANLDAQFGFGSKRDVEEAQAELSRVLQLTPQEDRPRVRKAFSDWLNETQKQPWELINPAITNRIKANLEREYAGRSDIAALRGTGNITQVLAWGDALTKESAARQLAAYRNHVLSRLDERRTELGRELTSQEAQTVINKALTEYGTKDPKQDDYLFPKDPAQVGGPSSAKPKPAPPPPGTRPSPVQGLNNPAVIDSAPDRAQRLQNWRGQPLLTQDATVDLVRDALGGRALPPAFSRAARDAGTTPEQLLIQQVRFYPEIQLSPQQQNKILKRGNQAQALNDNRVTRNTSGGQSLLAQAAGWMFDAVMGVRPAAAATSELAMLRQSGSYGTSSWSSGPAIAANHPETGRGYTLPGMKDAHGRPVILSRGGANSFAAMVRDSGGQVKASDIASAQRSETKNRAVGGARGSQHLGGNAMDIHGTSEAWIRKNGAKYGWYVHDYDGSHGGHFEFRGGGSAAPASRAGRGGGMTGLATYYLGSGGSDGVAGGPTANGERYNPNAMTAAVQWSLRGKYLNKWVTVEDTSTGRTVRVWVNDVGQMGGSRLDINRSDPRVIDLSPAAFRRLFGSLNRGVGRIRIVSAS